MTEPKNMNDPTIKVGDTVKLEVPEPYNFGWIDVKDKLPKRSEYVLIKLKRNKYLFPMDVSFRLVDGEYPAWGNTSLGARYYTSDEVTHWMPLPREPL